LRKRWLFAAAFDAFLARARVEAFEAAVKARADAEGITARIEATEAGLRAPAFYTRFHAALACTPPEGKQDVNQIRAIALHILEAMGIDTGDVHLTLFWAGPDGNEAEQLGPNELRFSDCSLAPGARARIVAAINERAADVA